jgi:hypothetical protein
MKTTLPKEKRQNISVRAFDSISEYFTNSQKFPFNRGFRNIYLMIQVISLFAQ